MVAEIVLGGGSAFISGADRALLWVSLEAEGRQSQYTRWDGRLRAAAQIGEAGSAAIGGWLYSLAPRLPFWLQVPVSLLAAGIMGALREVPRRDGPTRAPLAPRARAARRALHAVASPAAAGRDGPQRGARAVDLRRDLADPARRAGPRRAPGVVRPPLGGRARLARRGVARERPGGRRPRRARDAPRLLPPRAARLRGPCRERLGLGLGLLPLLHDDPRAAGADPHPHHARTRAGRGSRQRAVAGRAALPPRLRGRRPARRPARRPRGHARRPSACSPSSSRPRRSPRSAPSPGRTAAPRLPSMGTSAIVRRHDRRHAGPRVALALSQRLRLHYSSTVGNRQGGS